MIRSTAETAFLGVVVQPKTKAPIYVERERRTERTAIIRGVRDVYGGAPGPHSYVDMGSAYLNDMEDYAGPTQISGYPRSHTPSGVTERGGGFGTCLYTALVLMATAEKKGEIHLPSLIGSGAGISSTETDSSRSDSASRWWRAALTRGLVEQEEGTTGDATDDYDTETQTEEDEELSQHISRRNYNDITSAIRNAVMDAGDWTVSDITIKVDLEREVPRESDDDPTELTVDVYTMLSAVKHNLVACRETTPGDMYYWAKRPDFAGNAFKEVILALNVAKEDIRLVSKLALVAQHAGATESEITKMLMRNRIGVDVVSRRVLFEEDVSVAEELAHGLSATDLSASAIKSKRHRLPPRHESPEAAEAMLRMAVSRGATQNPPIRRNPAPQLTAGDRNMIDRDLSELERRRDDLGWNELGDLP